MKTTIPIACFILLAPAASLPARAQAPVTLPDPILESAVRVALGLPSPTPITSEHMLNLHHINIAGKVCVEDDDDDVRCFPRPVNDLTGLEHAHNLASLHLTGPEHTITDLQPIKGLTQLSALSLPEALKAEGDQAKTAASTIGSLQSLQFLNLHGCALGDDNLAQLEPLTNLLHLNLTQNRLSDLSPLHSMTKLRSLYITANNVASLEPLRGLTFLETLDIQANPILDLSPLSGMQRLHSLVVPAAPHHLISLPPLRRLRAISTFTNDIGPVARLDQVQAIFTFRAMADVTPLGNLEHLATFDLASTGIDDLSPMRLTTSWRPGRSSGTVFSAIDVSKPSNAAVIEYWQSIGALDRDITIPQDAIWKPNHFIPDGRLRQYISLSMDIPQDEITPDHLARPLSGDGSPLRHVNIFFPARSLEGLQHFPLLLSLNLSPGWIVDLTPLRTINLQGAYIVLNDNYINDVSPLVGKAFTYLDLRGNPINPATVPESWWSDVRVHLDPRPEFDLQEAIPDEGLRAAIRIALGLPVASPVRTEEVQRLEFLYAEERRITSLAGLEVATNLKGLALRNNLVTSLTPVSTLPSLQWLRASGNLLDTSAAAVLDSLRNRGVRVDDDPAGRFLSALTPVNEVVYADAYQLSSLRFLQVFPSVRELFLTNNHLRDIRELESLPNLARVHLSGNLLRLQPGDPARDTLDLLRSRGVTVIIDPQRPESAIGKSFPNEALQRAVADSAELPVTPAGFTEAQLAAVTEIDWERSFPVTKPPLKNPESLRHLPNLTHLSLENAGLNSVEFLDNVPYLTRLDLDFNQISDISAVAHLSLLKDLDVNNNQLVDISPVASLPLLETLDLDQNSIIDISAIAQLRELTFLDLHGNKVSDLSPLSELASLSTLDLKDNQIRDISPLSALIHLQDLDLEGNRIASFAPLRPLKLLAKLDLAYNSNALAAADREILDTLSDELPALDLDYRPQFRSSPSIIRSTEGTNMEWWGEHGVFYNISGSSDLKVWTHLGFVQGNDAPIAMPLPASIHQNQFFRVTP